MLPIPAQINSSLFVANKIFVVEWVELFIYSECSEGSNVAPKSVGQSFIR